MAHIGWPHRMAHSKWKETKQQLSVLPGLAVPDCSLVSFHFLLAILCPQAVVFQHRVYLTMKMSFSPPWSSPCRNRAPSSPSATSRPPPQTQCQNPPLKSQSSTATWERATRPRRSSWRPSCSWTGWPWRWSSSSSASWWTDPLNTLPAYRCRPSH